MAPDLKAIQVRLVLLLARLHVNCRPCVAVACIARAEAGAEGHGDRPGSHPGRAQTRNAG
jgi:hypothetical protein